MKKESNIFSIVDGKSGGSTDLVRKIKDPCTMLTCIYLISYEEICNELNDATKVKKMEDLLLNLNADESAEVFRNFVRLWRDELSNDEHAWDSMKNYWLYYLGNGLDDDEIDKENLFENHFKVIRLILEVLPESLKKR